jgi:hypothetical protein
MHHLTARASAGYDPPGFGRSAGEKGGSPLRVVLLALFVAVSAVALIIIAERYWFSPPPHRWAANDAGVLVARAIEEGSGISSDCVALPSSTPSVWRVQCDSTLPNCVYFVDEKTSSIHSDSADPRCAEFLPSSPSDQ